MIQPKHLPRDFMAKKKVMSKKPVKKAKK